MNRLVTLVDTNTPRIYAGNWNAEVAKGWRWERNIYHLDHIAAVALIEEYQKRYGVLNVAVGQPFDIDIMKPSPQPSFCGLYLRDTQDLVQDLLKSLDDIPALERWLSEEENV